MNDRSNSASPLGVPLDSTSPPEATSGPSAATEAPTPDDRAPPDNATNDALATPTASADLSSAAPVAHDTTPALTSGDTPGAAGSTAHSVDPPDASDEGTLVPASPDASIVPATPHASGDASIVPATPHASGDASIAPASPHASGDASIVPATPHASGDASIVPASGEAAIVPATPEAAIVPASPHASIVPATPEAAIVPATPAPPVLRVAPEPGDIVAGRYKVLETIGVGGMGTVYLAEHTAIEKHVALKLLAPQFAHDVRFRERFAREAKAISQINHENVVEVTDFGETEDGCPFLVMEYLRGRGLAQWLREEGPLPWSRAQPIFVQICKALHAAHHQGILHRDIKPENCFIVRRGARDAVKVLDFGLATSLSPDETAESTQDEFGGLIGTVEYMSPEQITGEPLTVRSDLYAVGILMYEVLSGYVPFSSDHHEQVMEQHLAAKPIPLQTLVPEAGISPEVEAVILQALAKDPEQRYATATDLGRALAALPAPDGTAVHETARERVFVGLIAGLSGLVVLLLLVLAYVTFAP